MTPDEKKSRIASLRNLIANHERRGKTSEAACVAAMEELNRLTAGGLEFARSFAAIRKAATVRGFITYGEVAAASGVPWTAARRQINLHLDELCRWAHAKGWPLITSIVVEQENRATGELGDAALAGFLKAAVRCGFVVPSDERSFLRAQQEQTFAWAASPESRT